MVVTVPLTGVAAVAEVESEAEAVEVEVEAEVVVEAEAEVVEAVEVEGDVRQALADSHPRRPPPLRRSNPSDVDF